MDVCRGPWRRPATSLTWPVDQHLSWWRGGSNVSPVLGLTGRCVLGLCWPAPFFVMRLNTGHVFVGFEAIIEVNSANLR